MTTSEATWMDIEKACGGSLNIQNVVLLRQAIGHYGLPDVDGYPESKQWVGRFSQSVCRAFYCEHDPVHKIILQLRNGGSRMKNMLKLNDINIATQSRLQLIGMQSISAQQQCDTMEWHLHGCNWGHDDIDKDGDHVIAIKTGKAVLLEKLQSDGSDRAMLMKTLLVLFCIYNVHYTCWF